MPRLRVWVAISVAAAVLGAGCLDALDPPEERVIEIAAGSWHGVPFSLSEPSTVHASFWTVGTSLVEACLVDRSEGPVRTDALRDRALACQTGVAEGGTLAPLGPGAYTLALHCLNDAQPCDVHVRLTVQGTERGPVAVALASPGG